MEAPNEIIQRAISENEECIKSLEVLRKERGPKHTGVSKTSKPQNPPEIPSTSSAFKPIQLESTKDRRLLQVLKKKEGKKWSEWLPTSKIWKKTKDR